jgi:hypothetical protein
VLQTVETQHALQADRWTAVAGPGVERLDQGAELPPRHDLVHLGKELGSAGLPTVFVEAYARQRRSPHLKPTPPLRLSSYRSIRDRVARDSFRDFPKVASVRHADVDALHRRILGSGPYRANRTMSVISKMFNLVC